MVECLQVYRIIIWTMWRSNRAFTLLKTATRSWYSAGTLGRSRGSGGGSGERPPGGPGRMKTVCVAENTANGNKGFVPVNLWVVKGKSRGTQNDRILW